MPSTPQTYSVVIVGGGPAGAAAGVSAAHAGLTALIVERDRYPRDKPCAGGVSGRCARAMAEVFGPDALPRFSLGSSRGVRLMLGDRLVADECEHGALHYARRADMDAALIDAAREAGCQVREGVKVAGVDAERGEIALATGETLSAQVIIAADGVESVVRRQLLGRRRRRDLGLGVVADVPAEELMNDELRDACTHRPLIDFAAAPWGYGWVFPKGGCVSIGVGAPVRHGLNLREAMRQFAERYCRAGAWERMRVRGHRLPAGDCGRRPGRGRVLLAGDAAGFVDAVTGEGISFAIESGRFAAQAAAQALGAGEPLSAGERYSAACRGLVRHMRQARLARWLIFPRPCLHAGLRVLSRRPRLVRSFMDLLAGDITYAGYFSSVIVGR